MGWNHPISPLAQSLSLPDRLTWLSCTFLSVFFSAPHGAVLTDQLSDQFILLFVQPDWAFSTSFFCVTRLGFLSLSCRGLHVERHHWFSGHFFLYFYCCLSMPPPLLSLCDSLAFFEELKNGQLAVYWGVMSAPCAKEDKPTLSERDKEENVCHPVVSQHNDITSWQEKEKRSLRCF